jgi:Fe(3+) dicitrate transport protein
MNIRYARAVNIDLFIQAAFQASLRLDCRAFSVFSALLLVVLFSGEHLLHAQQSQQSQQNGSDTARSERSERTSPISPTSRAPTAPRTYRTKSVNVESEKRRDLRALRSVEGAAIYEAKKTELITPDELTANRATNNARQIFAKVAGVNVWESDGAGLQLGIGARGLSPNRTANFNTRQNGCDMSADALGYPESYYTPPVEALERIEIVRGAASLQYGTQFGGMVNFVMKRGSADTPFSLTTRQTLGSWGFWNAFVSAGGTIVGSTIVGGTNDSSRPPAFTPSLNYYAFFQHKQGNGWRPNSAFNLTMGYASVQATITPKLSIQADYTQMGYLAQQPGGLTDRMFEDDALQSVRSRNFFRVNWQLAALTLDYQFSAMTQLNSRFFGAFSGRDALGNLERINVVDFGRERTLLADVYQNIGNETRIVHRYPSPFASSAGEISTLVAGVRLYAGNTTRKQGDGSRSSDADFRYLNPDNLENSSYVFPGRNVAVFAENIIWLAPNLSITPGVRWEYIATFADGFWRQRVFDFAGNIVADTRTPERLERVRSFVLGGVGVSYRFESASKSANKSASEPASGTGTGLEQSDLGQFGLELYGNFSQNFRAITFSDLRVVNPNFKVDSTLRDERGFNADVGLRGQLLSWLSGDATLFYLQYADRIGNVLRADEPPLFLPYRYRTNVGTARTIGVEALLEADWRRVLFPEQGEYRLSSFVNCAVLDAHYVESQDAAVRGRFVELAPPIMLRAGVNAGMQSLSVSVQYSFIGEHFTDATNAVRTATAVNGIIPAYSVWDLSAKYVFVLFERPCELEAGVNNLLDGRYFTRRADGYPGPGIIPSDGRSWYCTLGVRL